MARRISPIFALALALFLLQLPPLYAEEPTTCPCPTTSKHVLLGHTFLPSFGTFSPFADSHATISLLLGSGTYPATILIQEREFKIGTFSPSIEGQVNVLTRLAVNFTLNGNVTSGLNQESAIGYGASTAYSWKFGLLYELIRAERDVLSASLQITRPHTFAVSPVLALSDLTNIIAASNPDFSNENVDTRWSPDFRWAHAFNRVLGLQAVTGLRIDSLIEERDGSGTKTLLRLGAGLSADLMPVTEVPIALTLNYLRGQTISSFSYNSDAFSFGVYETFNPRFNVGVEIGFANTQSVDTTIGIITARTYYN